MSPGLFSLAIEPVVILLCMSEKVEGIPVSPIVKKVSLYADDTLYLNETDSCLSLLDQFRELSGV